MPQSLPYPMRAGLEERRQAEIGQGPYQVLVCWGGGGGGGSHSIVFKTLYKDTEGLVDVNQ